MGTKRKPPTNREQRRAEQFGRSHGAADGSPDQDPTANPAFGRGGDDQAAYTGRPDQDVTRQTGPGTGGATETEGQRPHHEGAKTGHSTKG